MYAYFHIDYNCKWGEQLYIVTGQKPTPGDTLTARAFALDNDGRGTWFGQMDANRLVGTAYHYVVVEDGRIKRVEWGDGHFLPSLAMMSSNESDTSQQRTRTLHFYDGWIENPADRPFFSSAFTESIFAHPRRSGTSKDIEPQRHRGQAGTLTMLVEAATVRRGMVLGVCGNQPALGDWNPEHAAVMDASGQPTWRLSMGRDSLSFPMLYKFVLLDAATHALVAWEDCPNRYFDPGTLSADDSIVLRNLRFNSPLNPWRGAGVAIPVFSLRSRQGCGVGEFADIKLLVDWAERTGQRVIQLLPVNDTTMTRTWRDSYPYNCNSTFALNPIYIRLEDVGVLADSEAMKAYRKKRQQLQRLPAIDWEKVVALKWDYLSQIFADQGDRDLQSQEYLDFHQKNSHWLEPYADYCVARDKGFLPSSPAVAAFHKFIQYHLHRQLMSARDYAHAHGVILKGDIPIGISRQSVDATVHPELFHLDSQAGAPPDAFDANGQNWGFPTYNWEAMRRDGYKWFRERFVKMSDYFDAYRIDHILGFFRIWEVPMDAVQGLLGHFNPALPLSPDEIRHDYGFPFDYDRHVLPYVTDESLDEIFDHDSVYIEQQVKQKFLEAPYAKNVNAEQRADRAYRPFHVNTAPNIPHTAAHASTAYRLAPRFATQRGVEGYYRKRPAADQVHKYQLYRLIADVLFVEDPHQRGRYHPRINGMDTVSYHFLPPEQQASYRRLHEDYFYHRHDAFWRNEAMRKLPALVGATRMLCCGEDLGMIPQCVPDVMRELRILSLEIQRMPKTFATFGDPQTYPYYSVCTTSSHDLSGIRAWWEESPRLTQRYYNEVLQCVGEAPTSAEPWICQKIVEQHLNSPAMLCILPLQDWLAIDGDLRYASPADERINVPSNPDNYWHYRMHLNLEELVAANEFNDLIASMVKKFDR